MSKSERFGIIERMLLSRRSVSFVDLQQRLEVSRATLHRDLRDLRERMQVPVVCDRETGNYRIDRHVERYELPGVWFSPGEIHALLSMQRLLVSLDASGILAEHIAPLSERLSCMLESTSDSAEEITRRVHLVCAAARHYAPQHFQIIAAALMERQRLVIRYCARSSGQSSEREISPQRLTHYRDNWYLDAWCHLRDELRSFAVDAIKTVKTVDAAARDIPESELAAALAAGYGIFAGTRVQWATLVFTPERARWVAAEHWHREQEGKFLDDGSYQLRLPYSNDPELIMDILKYGPDCQVVGPAGLREKVLGLLRAAVGRYGMSDERDFDGTDFLAHIRNDKGRLIAHRLEDHLVDVSTLAADFAAEFGAAPWAALAGIWHDLGKYREGFQRYIRQCGDPDAHIEGRVAGPEKTHSAAGALWAQQYLAEVDKRSGPVVARVLAYLIAGHHAGLDNWFGGLHERFNREDSLREGRDALAVAIPAAILKPPVGLPDLKAIRTDQEHNIPGRFALWVRMLFSCLVDADFLDTEAFMSQGKAEARNGFMPVGELEKRLAERLALMAKEVAGRGEAGSQVNLKRAEVLRSCLAKAELAPGVFSLTVPTGGGKTLSSLAFALRHAVRHGKRRIIYAIPYTSIIEQTAGIFRSIFGDENIIEHHSNVEVDETQETARSRLACENWDAPLIVTTNVQLLESLFASRTSRCRKLHNLVGSVIVLDEAQLLPVPYLQPVVDVLRLLVKDYGVTLVLCTATQPTLESRNSFDQARQLRGFVAGEIREIVDDVAGLYGALDRVRVHLPADLKTPRNWEQLAPQIAGHDAVLAIVGRRADARELYTRVKAEDRTGLWHLSGLMCAQHRSDTIADIKQALVTRRQAVVAGQSPAPIRVISTQLVEAGVDIDFPVVYRALAGLDSIAQAAGRCNREGRLDKGEVHVFVPPKPAPPGLLRMAEQATRILWEGLPPEADSMGVERFADFFRRLYGDANLDAKDVCNLLRAGKVGDVNFRTAAECFRLIDEAEGATVFVRYKRNTDDDAIDVLLNTLKKEGPQRWLLRKLQRYGVSIYQRDLQRLEGLGDIEALGGDFPGLYVQSSGNDVFYDRVLGINVDGAPGDPGSLVQ